MDTGCGRAVLYYLAMDHTFHSKQVSFQSIPFDGSVRRCFQDNIFISFPISAGIPHARTNACLY